MIEKKQRYNRIAFYKAYDLIKSNPMEACIKFREYIENYPEDYSAYPHYIMALIKIKKLEEAETVYSYIENILNNDPNVFHNDKVFDEVSFKLLEFFCIFKTINSLFNLSISIFISLLINQFYIFLYCQSK